MCYTINMIVHNKLPVPTNGQSFGEWTVIGSGEWKNGVYYEAIHQCNIGTRKFSSHELWRQKFKPCKSCVSRKKYRKTAEHVIMGTTYNQYKYSAKTRNYSFTLNLKQFNQLVTSNCFYCGSEPWQKRMITEKRRSIWHKGEFLLISGIDRVDNSIGYEIENCVPCCKTCNVAKQSLGIDEFKKMVKLWSSRMDNW